VLLAGCGGAQTVSVRVLIPDEHGVETPVSGLRVTFLPYDRDSVLAAMERAASPRPSTARLDSLFQAFREPFTAYLRASAALERLRRAAGASPAAALRDSLSRLERQAAAARDALAAARLTLQPAIDSLRPVIAAWEDSAFRRYDSVTAALARRRPAVVDSTGPDGWATVRLPAGRWWVLVRTFNVLDPYAEWYWNLPVTGDTMLLTPTNGRQRPKYR
jgi:hypothetical protein